MSVHYSQVTADPIFNRPDAPFRAQGAKDRVSGIRIPGKMEFHFIHGKEHNMSQASARHILVKTESECVKLKKEIEAGADFAEVAKKNSDCPSGRDGGDLGSFRPGSMVKEFDEVVFSGPVGKVLGPVKTQFGFHLIEVTERTA